MKPLTIISMILGGMSGILTFQLFGVGLVAGPSPGSIFAYLALTPRGNFIGVIAGVLVATIVSFLVTSLILKMDKSKDTDDDDVFEESVERSRSMKAEGKELLSKNIAMENVQRIAFACDAGMGSSAFGATSFKKQLQKENITDIVVNNYRIEEIPKDSDIIVVHKNLADRTKMSYGDKKIITIENYLKDPNLDQLMSEIKRSKGK